MSDLENRTEGSGVTGNPTGNPAAGGQGTGDRRNPPISVNPAPSSEIFTPPPTRSTGMPLSAWLVAGAVVLAVLGALVLAGHRKTAAVTGVQPLDGYSSSLPISQLKMSESTSLSGGKSTFIDGEI